MFVKKIRRCVLFLFFLVLVFVTLVIIEQKFVISLLKRAFNKNKARNCVTLCLLNMLSSYLK